MNEENQYALNSKEEIKNYLDAKGIKKYLINQDLSVDVYQTFRIQDKKLSHFPFQFGIIEGNLFCDFLSFTSLKGCPKEVYGSLEISFNKLTSLEYCPILVTETLSCNNNPIQNLDFIPQKVKNLAFGFNEMSIEKYVDVEIEMFKHITSSDKQKIEILKSLYKTSKDFSQYDELRLSSNQFQDAMMLLKEKELLEKVTTQPEAKVNKIKL